MPVFFKRKLNNRSLYIMVTQIESRKNLEQTTLLIREWTKPFSFSTNIFLFLMLPCFYVAPLLTIKPHTHRHTDEGLTLKMISSWISVRWPNYHINLIDKTKYSSPRPHRRSRQSFFRIWRPYSLKFKDVVFSIFIVQKKCLTEKTSGEHD